MTTPQSTFDTLLASAIEAATRSHHPYSHLAVGAAARTQTGSVVAGTNFEVANFSATIHAEATLLCQWRMGSDTSPLTELVCCDGQTGRVITPCGECRQQLLELAGPDLLVAVAPGVFEPLSALLPFSFDASDLPAGPASH